jgi:predicted RNA polymerase sigma factor
MRLADNCYRIENIETGLKYLEQLEADIKPRGFYIISLLKGKYMDHQKKFSEASVQFEKALDLYKKDVNKDRSVKGNILFRLGWALVRSRKDINKGI